MPTRVILLALLGNLAEMHHDCRMMLRRFPDECNVTESGRVCDALRNTREYRNLYYKIQAKYDDCYIL